MSTFDSNDEEDKAKSISFIESTKSEDSKKEEDIFTGRDLGEMVASLNIAPDGHWGWIVVAASFWNLMVIDGNGFGFGAMKDYLIKDFNVDVAAVAILNSLVIGLTYCLGPVASAFINRFGFRSVCMFGALICAICNLISSLALNYTILIFSYGIVLGIGYSMTHMCSILIIGFYFEKKRPLAATLAFCGSSFGITIAFPMYTFLNKIGGWRPTLMLQSSLMGTIFFTSMVYKPVLSITIQLPSKIGRSAREISAIRQKEKKLFIGTQAIKKPTRVNGEYKHAIDILEQENANTESLENLLVEKELIIDKPKQSRQSRIISAIDFSILNKEYSKLSDVIDLENTGPKNLQITIHNEKGSTCELFFCTKTCFWRPHVKQSRHLYRDDAFYIGNVLKLDKRRKNIIIPDHYKKTALEYNLAVTRVTTHKDLIEDISLRSTAIARVLATMADPKLLKLSSFSFLLISTFCSHLGLLIPYVYIVDRSKVFHIPEKHYLWFVTIIAVGGCLGRLVTNILVTVIPSPYCCQLAAILTGASTLSSNYFVHYYYQYFYCILFGFFSAIIVVCRSFMLVDLYGMELLTNATGLSLFAIGISFLIASPIAGLIMGGFGVYYSFMFSGVSQIAGGFIGLLVPLIRKCENRSNKRHRESKPISMVMSQMSQ